MTVRRQERNRRRLALHGALGLVIAAALGVAYVLGAAAIGLRERRSAAPPRTHAPAAPASSIDADGLRQQAKALPAARVAVFFQELGQPEVGYAADQPFPAASLIKLPLMVALFAAWEEGDVRPTPDDRARLRQMITMSDNAAANALLDRLGTDRIHRCLRRHGLRITTLRQRVTPRARANVTTARETGRLLVRLLEGKLVSPEASAAMRELLLASQRRTRIPALLPGEARCGNKTGTLRDVAHDAAFVEARGRRWVLCVLTEGARDVRAVERGIARLSRAVYDRLLPEMAGAGR